VTDLSSFGIAEIAELVGAVALVASLIFIGVELRHSATTARAAALQANMMFWKDFFALMADPETGRTYARGAEGRTDLTGEEFGRFYFICRTIFMGCENQHYQFTHGLIDDDAYRGYAASIAEQIASRPGVQAMWSIQRHIYGTEFQRFWDAQAAKGDAGGKRPTLDRWKSALPPSGEADAH
jgi:hypothetical protein